MKKVYLPLLIIATLSTACKKTYNCTCAVNTPGTSGGPGFTTTKYDNVTATSVSSALSKCNADAASTVQYSHGTYTCTIQN
ncbi:MAG TPA: hypothetical protein VK835_01115 [Bacteroidia bacterium]|jgi:hypothetical protein|nr:hypothetical protein [Bacteroidia bacterium]